MLQDEESHSARSMPDEEDEEEPFDTFACLRGKYCPNAIALKSMRLRLSKVLQVSLSDVRLIERRCSHLESVEEDCDRLLPSDDRAPNCNSFFLRDE